MMRRRAIFLAALLASPGACKDKTEPRPGGDDGPAGTDSTKRAKPKRADVPKLVDVPKMEPFGSQPGYLEGGLLYASFRVGETQSFWDSLPKPAELEREAEQAREELGFNPLSDKWGERFVVEPNAIVSATILRPIDADVGKLRKYLEGVSGTSPSPAGREIKEVAATLGYHTRIHIPSKDPAKTREAFHWMFSERDRERGKTACGDLDVAACAASGGGELAVFRDEGKALVVDFVFFAAGNYQLEEMGLAAPGSVGFDVAERKAVVSACLDEKPAKIAYADELAGDAALWIDPSMLQRLAVIDKLDWAIGSVGYEGTGAIAEQLERLERFEGLAEAKRLFPGVAISFDAEDGSLYGEANWPIAGALVGRLAARTIATRASSVPVPKAGALCEGSLACFRMQGLPDLRPVNERLLTGTFAKDINELLGALDRDEEYSFTLLLAGAWPNLLAAAANAPELMQGAEAGIARTVRDAVLRADGYGGRLDAWAVQGFLDFSGSGFAYSRTAKKDVDAAKGLLGLAGASVKDIELPDGKGRATELQEDGAHIYFKSDDEEFGWAAVTSGPEEFAKLLSMDSETPAGPMAYLELPNLWAMLEPADERELSFMREWARGRRLQFALELDAGQPRLSAALVKAK